MSYFDYYNNVIESQEGSIRGFKLVLGGTGLGKTRGIVQVAKHYMHSDFKFVYIANRIRLLEEMADNLIRVGRINSNQFIHQRSNRETVQGILQNHSLREMAYEYLRTDQGQSSADIRRDLDSIRRLVDSGLTFDSNVNQLVNWEVKKVIDYFKQAYKIHYQSDDVEPNELLDALFPFAAFQRSSDIKVALITVQKAFRGIFDGQRRISFTNLGENQGFIIFLDEFDFLERELIQLICDNVQIENPFRFVELFFDAMTRHKLPLDDYPLNRPEIRERIVEITDRVRYLAEQRGIPYPTINQFTRTEPGDAVAIFQSSKTYVDGPVFLRPTERAFDIVSEGGEGVFSSMDLFQTIRFTSNRILLLFKELESIDEQVYQEVKRQCFEGTDYMVILDRVAQFPHRYQDQRTRFDNFLERGFGLYEIEDLQQLTDRQEVKFRHFSVQVTPEKILSLLARNNMVFGLSATADIPRKVSHFSLSWLRRQMNVRYFEVEDHDKAIIQDLNNQKHERRNNRLTVEMAEGLSAETPADAALIRHLSAMTIHEEFGGTTEYHLQRVENFFETLNWIIDSKGYSADDTHLLFFNTFRQIHYVLSEHSEQARDLFSVVRLDSTLDGVFELIYRACRFIVIFYDARQAKQIHDIEQHRDYYQSLFWQDTPVLLVTQYQSAGNGVNLQYLPHPKTIKKHDFQNIHLLDAPYFYFGRFDHEATSQENNATFKQNAWYLGKLFESNLISWPRFQSLLPRLRGRQSYDLNDFYFNANETVMDATLNQVATYIQALGRIERVWTCDLPDQTVRLTEQVHEMLARFCLLDDYATLYEQHAPVMSNNVRQVFNWIRDEHPQLLRQAHIQRDGRLLRQNQRCEEAIDTLLRRISALRLGSEDQEARNEWQLLREVVLEHDYQHSLIDKYACAYSSSYMANGTISLDRDLNLYPEHLSYLSGVNRRDLNAAYQLIWNNTITRSHFNARGYQMAFDGEASFMFVPYCFQSILIGAIGEEAVRAVLLAEKFMIEVLPNALFETADFKFESEHWYIDCKNYGERTMEAFGLPPYVTGYHPHLNTDRLVELSRVKLDAIHNYVGSLEDVKLIYINLAGGDDRTLQYFDAEFNQVEALQDSMVVVIPAVLMRENPNDYSFAFRQFLFDVRALKEEIQP